MKRKLVKQGTTTMMVSLPSAWIKQNSLDKGDEIDISPIDKDLVISAKGKETKKETEISFKLLSETSIRTLITNLYRMGYDKIKVNFQDKMALEIIRDVLNNVLIGFDITKREKNYCVIESITEPSSEQFGSIFQKTLWNISELLNEFEKLCSGEKTENIDEIENLIKKYDNFLRRIIIKNNMYTEKLTMIWTFYTELTHAQREIFHCSKYLKKGKVKKLDKDVLSFINDAREIFQLLEKAYTKKDMDSVELIHEKEKTIYNKGYKIIKKEPVVVHHLISAIRFFYLAASPLPIILLAG